jgi:endonuclease/exonuclease/phosphatase family metal-dependent hydrolase
LNEFCHTLSRWEWEVALLQEVPPWWPPALARASGAAAARVSLTSRNQLLGVRRAVASRAPDLMKANGGGANAILVRSSAVRAHARRRLTLWPERRTVHGVALADATWVVNLHASTHPPQRKAADVAAARAAALRWADGAPIVLGGDFNTRAPDVPGFTLAASHHVDHVFLRGLGAAGPEKRLDAGRLSDHVPLLVEVERRP